MTVTVRCRSGYKAEERPEEILFGERTTRVLEVLDRWYSPGMEFFKVTAEDRYTYILRHDLGQDAWFVEFMEKKGG